jgi:hypothetical protein
VATVAAILAAVVVALEQQEMLGFHPEMQTAE